MADDLPASPPKIETRRTSYDAWNMASIPAKAQVETWQLARPMPGVLPKGMSTIAMDRSIQDSFEFAANSYLSEGLGFPGFAYLAELTQRAEYRRPAEIIAKEMTREWMKLSATGDDDKTDKITAINAELDRLDAQTIFRKAAEQDGFFGRAQIYLDTGDTDNPDELKTELIAKSAKIGKGKLKALRTVEAMWTYPNQYNSNNPLKEEFYRPDTWFVMGTEVHASRLLTLISRPLPDLLKPAYAFAGLSLSQMAKPYVDNWLRTRQSVSDGISNFSIMVLLTNLDALMMTGGDELFRRATMFNQTRDNRGLMVANKETEDLKNVSMPLSGLDHLQAQSQEHLASVTGIPLVKLLGITPSGLNASSEGEIQCFETWIGSLQEGVLSPALSRLIDIVQLSLFGEIDPEIGFKWKPLRALSELDLANARKIEADTDCVYIDHGVLSQHEVRQRIASDEDSAYSNIDVDVDPPMPDPAEEGYAGEEEQPAHDCELGHDGFDPDQKRGQPGNAGQFGPGSSATTVSKNEPGENHPEGGGSGKSSTAPNTVTAAHAATLKEYTGAAYRAVQATLRGGKAASDETKQHIAQLDDLLSNASLPEPKTVYRALGSLAVQQMLGKPPLATKGGKIDDFGFASTSESETEARKFFAQSASSVLMTIKMPKGSKALDITKYSDAPSEKETLIARGAMFKVVKFDPKSRKLEVELLPHPDEPPKAIDSITADSAITQDDDRADRFAYVDASGLKYTPSSDPNAEVFDLS